MKTLLFFALLTIGVYAEDDNPSSRRRLMDASRPDVGPELTLPLQALFPLEVLQTQPTAFQNVNLIEPELDNSPMQNESAIAANPLNPKVLIASAVDYRDGQSAWVYISEDGGYHWRNVNLGKPAGLNFIVGNDPSVAWDFEGRGYLVYGGFDSKRATGENGVFISITTDNGKTWSKHNPVILHRGTMTKDSAFEDKYYINVDNAASSPYHGRLYMPWKRVIDRDSSTQIVITSSADHGATWSTPKRISDILPGKSLDTTFGQSFPIASTGPKGELYVVWNHGPLHSIGFNSSLDGGKTWGTPRMIVSYNWLGVTMNMGSQYNHTLKGGTRVESYPSLVVDTTNSPRRGWLYLTWAADKVPNVYFARSTDGGTSWSQPVVVHRDTTNDQYWQWMSLDGTSGDIAVMYLDSRDDPSNKLSRCYVSLSRDGGTTWIDRPVDDSSFDIRRNPFAGGNISGVFAGDYSGCAFIAGRIFPSHVDMRNTYPNVGDNDVYSAVINVNAPLPVDNFRAKTIVDKPTRIALDWNPPANRAFGESMKSSDFSQVLYRDGALLQVFDGTIAHYDDDNLPEYSQHSYLITVVAKPGSDTSVARTAIGFAGGSPQPMHARLLLVANDTAKARLRIQLPTLRADSVNPLANLAKVRVYRDSSFFIEKIVSSTDTGKTEDISVDISERGYYSFTVGIVDASGHESARSNSITAFIGPLSSDLADAFDGASLAHYLVRGGWQQTDEFSHSAPDCITESKRAQYQGLARDTITFFPLRSSDEKGMDLSFRHAAIVDKSDTSFVEAGFYSESLVDTLWTTLASYNRTRYSEWQDATLEQADWKPELLHIPCAKGAIVAVRLRFKSNIVTNADGWYVDDLHMTQGLSDVADDASVSVLVYPNPASNDVYLHPASLAHVRIVDLLGSVQYERDVEADEISHISTQEFLPGRYVLQIRSAAKERVVMLSIVR